MFAGSVHRPGVWQSDRTVASDRCVPNPPLKTAWHDLAQQRFQWVIQQTICQAKVSSRTCHARRSVRPCVDRQVNIVTVSCDARSGVQSAAADGGGLPGASLCQAVRGTGPKIGARSGLGRSANGKYPRRAPPQLFLARDGQQLTPPKTRRNAEQRKLAWQRRVSRPAAPRRSGEP